MTKTKENLEKIRKIMNTNEAIQEQMTELSKMAEEKNLTEKQWENFKIAMMTTLFYKMCEKMPSFKDDLAEDIYNELRA